MDLNATVSATHAAAAACRPLKHHLMNVSAAASQGRSVDASLGALAAAVSAVESATDAAEAAATAAAAGFAAEMEETGIHPLDYGPATEPATDDARYETVDRRNQETFGKDEPNRDAGYKTEDRRNREAFGKDEPHREASAEPDAPDMERADPSYQTSNQAGNPTDLDTNVGPADVHEGHMRYDQPSWHDVTHNHEDLVTESYALKAPLQIPSSSTPSPKRRVTSMDTPMENEPPPIIIKDTEHLQTESGRRVSTRMKSKSNEIVRLGKRMTRIFELGTADSQVQKKGQIESAIEEETEVEDVTLPVLPPPKVSSEAPLGGAFRDAQNEILETKEEEGAKHQESQEQEANRKRSVRDVEANHQESQELGAKRKRSAKSTASGLSNNGDDEDGRAEKDLSVTETPCRPRAAKLVAQRLCAPRKRHRAGSLRSRKQSPRDDEQDDEDDADFETNENDAETDDEDIGEDTDVEEELLLISGEKAGKGGRKADTAVSAEHPLVLAHGTVETAISKVPDDMSGWKLVPGMVIKASILEECMMLHAQQNHNEVLVAILALQTSQYWSYRCHCHGTAPKPADGRVRTKSKKCKCAWRICFRVVNEKETLEAKSRALHPDNRRPAQIAVALLQVNSVHEQHTGHTPEPYIRGIGVKSGIKYR